VSHTPRQLSKAQKKESANTHRQRLHLGRVLCAATIEKYKKATKKKRENPLGNKINLFKSTRR
jgi:hypothetical protein